MRPKSVFTTRQQDTGVNAFDLMKDLHSAGVRWRALFNHDPLLRHFGDQVVNEASWLRQNLDKFVNDDVDDGDEADD